MKLAGSALVASAVGLLGANEAQAEVAAEGRRRRLCNRKGGDYCNTSGGGRRCSICCGEGGRRRKACCGSERCNCCRRSQTCKADGRCV
jgi:hypothetical protein